MRTNPRTLLALAATGTAVMLSMSACFGAPSGSDNSNDGTGANSSPSAAAAASLAPCQTSAPELYIYLSGDKTNFAKAGSPPALGDPVCVANYALASVKAKAGATPAPEYVLFSQQLQNGHWNVLAVGAAGLCAGKLPDNVAKVLPGCDA